MSLCRPQVSSRKLAIPGEHLATARQTKIVNLPSAGAQLHPVEVSLKLLMAARMAQRMAAKTERWRMNMRWRTRTPTLWPRCWDFPDFPRARWVRLSVRSACERKPASPVDGSDRLLNFCALLVEPKTAERRRRSRYQETENMATVHEQKRRFQQVHFVCAWSAIVHVMLTRISFCSDRWTPSRNERPSFGRFVRSSADLV